MVKNSAIIVVGIIISNILAYVFHIYAGRVLGPADYGVFGALMALFMIIALPAGAISSAITKFTSRFSSKKDYNKIGLLRKRLSKVISTLGVILFILILVFSRLIADYLKIYSNIPVIIVGITLIFALILPINRGILQGMKKFKHYSLNSIIESISRLILLAVLLFFGLRVNGAILAYGLAYFVAFLFIFPFIKETNIKNKKDNLNIKPIYHFILLVLSVNLVLQLIINAPTIFIKHFASSEFTGYWTAALNLARISLFVTGGISVVMFPEVAEKEDHREKRKIFKKALFLSLLASIAIALIFLLLGKFAVLLLYGKAYLPAVPILEYMGLAMIPLGILQLWVNYRLARLSN